MPRRPSFPRRILLVAGTLLATILAAGCATGERPSFAEEASDPAVEAMALRLERVGAGPFTAAYDTLTKFGVVRRPATATVSGADREVVVGTVRFVEAGGSRVTCQVDLPGSCVDEWQPQRISDTLLTPDFYATDTARRLRRDGQSLIGPPSARTTSFAGEAADCLDLPLPGGTAVYCVLANGLLALLDDGDVRVELTAYTPAADPSAFAIGPR